EERHAERRGAGLDGGGVVRGVRLVLLQEGVDRDAVNVVVRAFAPAHRLRADRVAGLVAEAAAVGHQLAGEVAAGGQRLLAEREARAARGDLAAAARDRAALGV